MLLIVLAIEIIVFNCTIIPTIIEEVREDYRQGYKDLVGLTIFVWSTILLTVNGLAALPFVAILH